MKNECPNCGAEIPAASLKCAFCNYEVKSDTVQTLKMIQELQAKLTEVDNSVSARDKMLYGEMQIWRTKASIILAFALPNTKADLVSLLTFAHSNYEGSRSGIKLYGDPVRDAWLAKAKQAFMMLKVMGKEDEHVRALLAPYAFLDSTGVQGGNQGGLRRALSSLMGKRSQ